jgi:sugar lactone lactonase YvrE
MAELNCIWEAGAELGEGVFWHGEEQALYWIDIIASRLHRLSQNGEQHSWHFPGSLSSAVPCIEGGLLATFQTGLAHIDLAAETVTSLIALEQDLPGNRFNDGCSDTRGQYWFGSMDNDQTQASGRFYCLDNHGQVKRLDAFGHMTITNGPTFSLDGQWVYFTDTVAGKIFRAELDQQGRPAKPILHIAFGKNDGHPDGMCTDTAGGLWVCHWGAARVSRYNASGELDQAYPLPVPNITKCCFGGANMQTLYITTAATGLDAEELDRYPLAGGLFAVDVPYTGVAAVPVSRP